MLHSCSSISAADRSGIRRTYEMLSRMLEKDRLQESIAALSARGIALHGFYHSDHVTGWRERMSDHLLLLSGRRRHLGRRFSYWSAITDDPQVWDSGRWGDLLAASESLLINTAAPQSFRRETKEVVSLAGLSSEVGVGRAIRIEFNLTVPVRGFDLLHSEHHKLTARRSRSGLSSGRFSTLSKLHEFCRREVSENRTTFVYFVHNGDSSHWQADKDDIVSVLSWRDLVDAYMLEFSSICIRALLRGYIACGVGYDPARVSYTGDMWWSTCDHIARLKLPESPFDTAMQQQFLFRVTENVRINKLFASRCSYDAFNCGVTKEETYCHRDKYIPSIYDQVVEYELPDKSSIFKICSIAL